MPFNDNAPVIGEPPEGWDYAAPSVVAGMEVCVWGRFGGNLYFQASTINPTAQNRPPPEPRQTGQIDSFASEGMGTCSAVFLRVSCGGNTYGAAIHHSNSGDPGPALWRALTRLHRHWIMPWSLQRLRQEAELIIVYPKGRPGTTGNNAYHSLIAAGFDPNNVTTFAHARGNAAILRDGTPFDPGLDPPSPPQRLVRRNSI